MANDDNNQNQDLENQQELANYKEFLKEKQKTLEFTLKEIEAQVKTNQLTQGQADLLTEIAKTQDEIRQLKREGQDIDVEELANLQKKLELTQNLSNAINDAATQGGLLADKIAPISNSFSRAAVASFEAGKGIRGMGAAIKAYGLNAAKGLSFSKVLFSGVERLIESTIAAVSAADAAGASFVQATGASRDFARAAFDTRESLGLMGISGAEAVGTMGRLYSGFSEFSELSRDSQQDFTVLSAQIEKLGGDAAGMAQTFTKVAGMSLAETETAMREVAGAADALGIPFSQVSADLVAMGELFAKMGSGAMDVFLELQAASKATGLSVQELYNIVGQYDTFEASSQAAGRLNMVLGGNLLDTYSLLNATEEERIELLQRAMEQSSLTFDEMDRYQKREVSDALNISLEEAAQLFGTTRGEVEKTAAELMHAGMTQEELAQRTRDASTAMDKFKVLMGNLAILVGPIVEKLNDIVDGLLGMTEGMGATKAALLVLSAGLAAAALSAGLLGLRMRIAAAAAGPAGRSMAAGIGAVSKASTKGVVGLGIFAAAALVTGAGVWLLVRGLAALVSEFHGLDPDTIRAAAGALIKFSAATVLMGVSRFMGGSGAVKKLVKNINKLETDKVNSFAAAMSSLEGLANVDLAGSGVPGFIRDVGEALNELPDSTEKTVAFKATADSLANLMQIGSSVEAEQLERIKMIIDAVSNAEGAESTNRLADAINSLVRGQANNQGTTNTIELDGRVLARWIDRHDATRFRASIER